MVTYSIEVDNVMTHKYKIHMAELHLYEMNCIFGWWCYPNTFKNSSYIDGNKDVQSTVGKKTAVLFTSNTNQAVHLSYETLFLLNTFTFKCPTK